MAADTLKCKWCGQDVETPAELKEHIATMHPEMTEDLPSTGTAMPGIQGTPGAEDETPPR